MRKLGLKYQILLLTLIPILLIGGIFTYNHIRGSVAQQADRLRDHGQMVARHIATAIEPYLRDRQHDRVQLRLEQAVAAGEVLQAAVYDRQGARVAEAASAAFETANSDDHHYFRQAIVDRNKDITGISGADSVSGWVNLYLSRLPLQQKAAQIVIESIVFFIAVLIVALLLTSIVSRHITQPIFRLMEHLRDVEQGQLGKAIEPIGTNEIGELQQGFNRMTSALLANRRHLNRRIEQATHQLNEAITDLESRNRELGFARDLAQNANRTKSEFLANMSHEIRTPINGIKGFIGLLGQTSLDPAQRRYVEIIGKSTADLTGIVDEILDFSKMESGKLQIVDETFDLYEVIEQTRDILFINALAKDIDLNLVLFSDTPQWVIGDKLRLKQILLNLIGNAIKFTDHGKVVIRVSLEELDNAQARISICVQDSGIGISEKDQQSLFKAFSQVDNADTRRSNGTGLGLVISKNLASLMGGGIDMQSTPGEGSRFTLSLPFGLAERQQTARQDEPGAVRAMIFASEQTNLMETRTLFDRAGAITEGELADCRQGHDSILQTIHRNLAYVDLLVFDLRNFDIDLDKLLATVDCGSTRIIAMHYDPGHRVSRVSGSVEFVSIINSSRGISRIIERVTAADDATQGVAEPHSTQAKKVLLVDDNAVNLKLASELVRLWGHQAREAEHADAALDIYRREKFDLVILDIQMPDIDGVSLLQMMREISPRDNTPMVALTANVLNDEARRLLDLGFDYFLGKPIDEDSFRALLDGQPQRQAEIQAAQEDAEVDCSLDYSRSLELAAGNPSLLRQIFEILQRDIPEQRQALQDAFNSLDRDRLGALAHKLHGVTCYASLPRLRRVVLAFQQQLANASRDTLESMVAKLDAELATVEGEVEQCLQRFTENSSAEAGSPGRENRISDSI